MENQPEVWLRGPLPDIDPYLQPVAHALLQAREEIHRFTKDFPEDKLWVSPFGVASVGFHLRHIRGVIDRLFTYAAGNRLSEEQFEYLRAEGRSDDGSTIGSLVEMADSQIRQSVEELKKFEHDTLNEFRGVGRQALPSTVLGLLFHAAEHTQRHVGQLYVTVKAVSVKP